MDGQNLANELDCAIEAEISAEIFYRHASKKTDNPSGAAMFKELADLEHHHKEHLSALRQALSDKNVWPSYAGRKIKVNPVSSPSDASPPISYDHADAVAALRAALSFEEESETRYRRLAATLSDEPGKTIFTRLAEEEASHRRLLDDQLYALSNQGVWLWGD